MLTLLNGHCMEHGADGFVPTTIKSHMVMTFITWSIHPDENNNNGLVYIITFLSFLQYWHDQILIITPGSAILEI